jgi:ureidoacrylate peracid hydrolase
MVDTMLVACARNVGGNAIEIVVVAPPIIKARRVVCFPLFTEDVLIMTSLSDARAVQLFTKVSTIMQALCHAALPVFRRARFASRVAEVAMWIAERGQEPDFASLINPDRTAVIVIDVQNDFCHADGAFGRVGHDNSRMPDMAAALHRLLAEARSRRVLTIFVRATYDKEVTSRPLAQHRRRLGLLQSLCLEGTWGADWFAGVAPAGAPNEVVLTKHRFDAFQGTPLDLYLRSNGIETVIVTGVVTSGCVESTVRDAFFLDYRVVVPHDGVAEAAQERHDIALAVMQRSFATVTGIDEIVKVWRQSNAPVAPSWQAEARRERIHRDGDAEGLVLIDVDALDPTRAAAARSLSEAATQADMPIFDVRSIDVALGRGAWSADESAGSEVKFGVSSPALMHITKMRRSAFADTRLGLLLRTNDIRRVTIAGADKVVSSLAATIFDALDADYAVTVASDACVETTGLGSAAQSGISSEIAARWRKRASSESLAESRMSRVASR